MGNSVASTPARGGVTVCRAVSGDDLDPRDGSVVMLNVYDLNKEWLSANHILKEVLQIGGAFHAGIEVHGVEFTYGCDGISENFPKCHDVHIYRQTVIMGRTDHTLESVQAIVDEQLDPIWKGEEYSMLNHNCVSFCRCFCKLLVGLPIPGWVDRLAKLASSNGMDKIIEKVLDIWPDSADGGLALATEVGSLAELDRAQRGTLRIVVRNDMETWVALSRFLRLGAEKPIGTYQGVLRLRWRGVVLHVVQQGSPLIQRTGLGLSSSRIFSAVDFENEQKPVLRQCSGPAILQRCEHTQN